jgi:hypothetical protein
MTTIKQELTNRNESVERIYSFYAANRFLVNRRYQRKLVWSIDEKRAFADSLRKNFPVPLILLADVEHEGEDRFEIIDGMQRLNAITSFIEGEFDLEGAYFDLESMAETKLLLDTKELKQNHPTIDRDICVRIVRYNLPLTVYPAASHTQIDEIFRRINSYGKHLSRQELRMAGVTTDFSQLVRNLASRVRGDVSAGEKLYLGAMRQISITSRELLYGINVDDIFWVQNKIFTREDIRQSRDEEIIADMLGYILLTPKLSSTAEIIDEFFGYSRGDIQTGRMDDIGTALKKVGADTLAAQYMAVHENIRTIFEAAGKKFSDIVFQDPVQRAPRYYQSIFLALWELLVDDNFVIRDYEKVAKSLDGAGKHIQIGGGGGRFSGIDRTKNINVVKGLIQPACEKRNQNDPALSSWTTELENILMQSYTEQSMYDFKQGFLRLDGSHSYDEAIFSKIFKTLAAMANYKPTAVGYVIVGVADNAAALQRLKDLYDVSEVSYQRFLITGIEHEAKMSPKGLDSYFLMVTQKLRQSGLADWAKDQINRDLRVVNYFGRSVIVFRVEAGGIPCLYEGKYYERHGSNIAEIAPEQYAALFSRFLSPKQPSLES